MMWTSGKFSAWRSGPRLFGDCGVIDFAGSGTVHLTGGVAAFVACIFMGTRKGFPDNLPEGQPVYQALGIFILWMGWYGFNCVSTLYIDGYAQSAGHVSITSPCAVVSPALAVVIGLLGGGVYVAASKGMVKAGLDDAVDAVAVHGACGIWGVIAAGLFA